MAYCTPDDVRKAFPKVLTAGLMPEEADYLCERWSAFVDGYLTNRYATPVLNPPPILRMLTADLVWLDVLDRSPRAADFIVRRRAQIMDALLAYSSGTASLPGVEERTDRGVVRVSTPYVKVFGGVPSLDERYDPDRAQDEANDRD